MKGSSLIREAYFETEKYFADVIDRMASQKNFEEFTKLQQLSKINENAYFVLFWGQFEAFINDKVLQIESSALDMGIMSRIQLVISPTHEYYKEIDRYYVWRCKIAHGEVFKLQAVILATIFDKIDEIIDKIENWPLPLGDDFEDF